MASSLEDKESFRGLSFFHLPTHIVENILGYLNYGDVAAMRGLCHRLKVSCSRILRCGLRRLKQEIFNELVILQQQLLVTRDPDTILQRVPLLRCYNVLEVLRGEHRLLCALCRRVLVREDLCFPAGRLLDKYYEIIAQVKARNVPQWSMDSDVTTPLLVQSKKFLDGFLSEGSENDPSLGVRIADLLDTLLTADYTLTVTYDVSLKVCHLTGEYELCDARFLSLPPDIQSTLDGLFINKTGARLIIDYLINIVRFNNRLFLREEQYWREMEATRRAQQDLQQQGYALSPAPRVGVISRQPRDYSLYRLCRERKIISKNVIRETYREHGSRKCPFKGFWSRINLTCPLDDAPFELMDNWKRLSSQVSFANNLDIVKSYGNLKEKICNYIRMVEDNSERSLNAEREEEEGDHFQDNVDAVSSSTSASIDTKEVSSSSTTDSVVTDYAVLVEFRVSIPMRGYDPEVYKLCFRDGYRDDESTPVREAQSLTEDVNSCPSI